jgi:murein DD-endopeptidase MepM/ murein hydrolase activator NlpD
MILVVTTFLPTTAKASMLGDFLATITGADTVQADTSAGSGNVQTMSILTPATNIDPSPSTGRAGTTIVDNTALVPAEGPSGTVADIQKKTQNGGISIYVVRPGDTLSGIAALLNITEGTILAANDLTPKSIIQPGDQLVILPISGLPYTVKSGDTLASIAKRFGGDPTDIGNYNGIDDSTLVPGTQISIPDTESGSYAAAGATTADTGHSSSTKTGSKAKHVATTKVLEGSEASGDIIPLAHNPAEPSHNVGPAGTASQIAYYIAPLTHYIQTQGIHGYNAVDLAAPTGTPILAAADGEVIVAREGGWNGGYGSYVVITHDNGSQTLYAHMSKVAAYDGEDVVQGQVIGYVGMTGDTTGPHVHFEIRDGIRNPF